MKYKKLFACFSIIIISGFLSTSLFEQEFFELKLQKSGKYIGSDLQNLKGYDGTGIKIGIIDTGIDITHPDLMHDSSIEKIRGFDFVENNNRPDDQNGHGTEVAGIINANGNLKGIAPKAEVYAYKVSNDGNSISSEFIVEAIRMAIEDDMDVINISLGVNNTNSKIESAVNDAIKNNIVVVVAAGNDGPNENTISNPGRNQNVITVGATYNNVTSSLVSTLTVDDKNFQVMPMIGTQRIENEIVSKIVFGNYARERDFVGDDFGDLIILAERGSDVENEIVFFSDKEKNAADSGARALVVFNNEPGIFFGELVHEFTSDDYFPSIPVVSISREDGLLIKEMIDEETTAEMNVFYNPDFVAFFSSRGPVSPFYIKPDLVAPGIFVNSTLPNGLYNMTSGTSFATPHVSGTAALLLQKNPDLSPIEVKSILTTTSDIVSDQYQNEFSIHTTGAGRLNATRALDSELVILPNNLIFNFSPFSLEDEKFLQIMNLDKDVKVEFQEQNTVDFRYELDDNGMKIFAKHNQENFEEDTTRLILEQNDIQYQIPILSRFLESDMKINNVGGKLNFEIFASEWQYAKISAFNSITNEKKVTSITPTKQSSDIMLENGAYWIEANIKEGNKTSTAYSTIVISDSDFDNSLSFDLVPVKPLLIILGIISIVSIVGVILKIRN